MGFKSFFTGSKENKKFIDQSVQNRDRFNERGDEQAQYLKNEGDYYDTNEKAYQQQADEAYQELRNEPGYSDAEMGGIYGDPNAAFKYYDPDQLSQDAAQGSGAVTNASTNYGVGIRDAANRAGGSLRGAASSGTEGLRRAAGNLGTGMRTAADEYGADLGSAVERMRPGMEAPSNDQLAWQGGVYNYLKGENEGGLDEYGNKLESATSRDRLGLSKNFATDYAFTDTDGQNMKDIAAQATAGQYRKMGDQARLRAAAQGNTSPAAMAAIEANLGAQGAAEAGDAATRAAMAANQERARRVQDIEGMRLGAERDISGRQTANAGNLYEGRSRGSQNLANMEMQGIESATGNRMKTAGDLAKYGYEAADTTGRARMDAAKLGGEYGYKAESEGADLGYKAAADSSGYDYKAADMGGQADMDATRYGADTKLATNRYNQATGQGLATGADAAGVARSAKIADTRRAGEADYRGYLTDAQKSAQAGGQATQGQRLQNYNAQGGLVSDATATGMKGAQFEDNKPSGFSKLLSAANQVAGVATSIAGIPKMPKLGKSGGSDYGGGASKGFAGGGY